MLGKFQQNPLNPCWKAKDKESALEADFQAKTEHAHDGFQL